MLHIRAFISLIKIRITLNVSLIAAIGWYVANQRIGNINNFLIMLVSTAFVCAGVCVFNHVLEWKSDALMKRTQSRPIPSGEVGYYTALIGGFILSTIGLIIMIRWISTGMFVGAFITGVLYIVVYTPFKKISWLNTTVGAIPGALPIMGGWFAARGELGIESWILFLVLFFWQHPHFYAIAWVCKQDYATAGYKMITENDAKGKKTFRHSFFHVTLLAITTLGLLITDFKAGFVYLFIVIILNFWFGYQVWRLLRFQSNDEKLKNQLAQKVVKVSVWYLVLYFAAIVMDNAFRITII